MNKLNYILAPLIIILIIGNIFLYSSLSKQNSDIKKDISDIKKTQIDQQAGQKESIDNLQNLVTFNWKTYQNDEFGFSFKYPEYVNICSNSINLEKGKLDLGIRTGGKFDTCNAGDAPTARLMIKKNTENYKTAEEAFYKEFPFTDNLLEHQYNYTKISKKDASDIKNISRLFNKEEGYVIAGEGYSAIILKNGNIITMQSLSYNIANNNNRLNNKPIIDAIISTFYFN